MNIPCETTRALADTWDIKDYALALSADEEPEPCYFQLASLSKTIATALSLELFHTMNVSLDTPVNSLLDEYGSDYSLNGDWSEEVSVRHLLNHTALNLHYVHGLALDITMPPAREFLHGNKIHGYDALSILNKPGSEFHYSGGGFLLLEHLVNSISGESTEVLGQDFFEQSQIPHLSFAHYDIEGVRYASAHPGTRLRFPAFAAGAHGTAASTFKFLRTLSNAFHNADGAPGISHRTARSMLGCTPINCEAFMGCMMGLGVFIASAGRNRMMIHQGANDGFRALFLYCFDGPDKDRGFVLCSAGEQNAVHFIAEAAQAILMQWNVEGIDFSKFRKEYDDQSGKCEERVNKGYKELLFDAFIRD